MHSRFLKILVGMIAATLSVAVATPVQTFEGQTEAPKVASAGRSPEKTGIRNQGKEASEGQEILQSSQEGHVDGTKEVRHRPGAQGDRCTH